MKISNLKKRREGEGGKMSAATNTFLTRQIHPSYLLCGSTLVCQFLLLSKFKQTSTTKSVFLSYRSQKDVHLFCKFRMMPTWTNDMEKRSPHDWEFWVTIKNEFKKKKVLGKSWPFSPVPQVNRLPCSLKEKLLPCTDHVTKNRFQWSQH